MKHRWDYCDLCERWMVVCWACGNNACNGGYGEVNGYKCRQCVKAYALQDSKVGMPE